MKKARILSMVLVMCMLVASFVAIPAVAATTGTTADGFKWSDDGTIVTITGYVGSGGDISIPSSINSHPVKNIGSYAFNNCTNLTSVTIQSGMTNIGQGAFSNCTNLLSVTLPNSITSLGSEVFSNCTKLLSVSMQYGITSIGILAFNSCYNLTNLIIPSSVTSIGINAFYNCRSLTSITIPGSLTSISNGAFESCRGLKSIIIEAGVTSIGNNTFAYCNNLESITIPDSITSIGVFAFYSCTSLKSVTIPFGVTNIKNDTFSNCSSLTSISIPESVISIEEYAFANCGVLANVTIPSSVKIIGKNAFEYCLSMNSIVIPYGVASINDSVFHGCEGLLGVTIPESVTSIGVSAFENCIKLNNLTIPASVNSIGWDAFCGCVSLTSIIIPDGVTRISEGAFQDCLKLASITIPNSVTSIDTYAFYNCKSLTSITLPDSVASIGSDAFSSCTSLKSVNFSNTLKTIADRAFWNCWSLKVITIPDSCTSIGEEAFYNGPLSVYIPVSVTSIGDDAFSIYGGFKIYGVSGSYAQTYAAANDAPFKTFCTITFNSNGGNAVASKTTNYGTAITAPANPTKANYTFAGWYDTTYIWDFSVNELWNFNDVVKDELVLTAKWTANQYTVTFNSNGGSAVASKTADYNTTITAPANPTRAGYVFNGWYTAVNGGSKVAFPYKVISNVTLYAGWTFATPTNLKAVSASYNSIKLTWNAVSGANGYQVFRSTSQNGTYSWAGTVTGTSFTNSNLTCGKTYYYKVRAYKGNSYSAFTGAVSAKPVPATVVNLSLSKASSTSIKIKWSAVAGASGYQVFRATSLYGTYTWVNNVTSTSYTNSGLTKNKYYYYKVRAYRVVNGVKVYGAFSIIKSLKL